MRKIFLSLCIFLLSIVGFAMQSIGKTDIKHWIQENSSINTPYKEKSQELEGMVLDEEGYAISEATLEVKQNGRSEEHTSELQSRQYLVCRLLLEKKKICTTSTHRATVIYP